MAFHGAHIAAAAAEKKRRRMQQEEEERMTPYTPKDLNEDWEFKIVRSETAAFRKPEVFQHLLQEEAATGWQLVEKLDDMRVRFKRPAAARKRDAMLPPGVDPYRSHYGVSTRTMKLIMLLVVLVLSAGITILALVMGDSAPQDGGILMILSIGAVAVLVMLILLLAILRLLR